MNPAGRERELRKAREKHAGASRKFRKSGGAVIHLAYRDIASSEVEPHVKSAQKIETEQPIYAAC